MIGLGSVSAGPSFIYGNLVFGRDLRDAWATYQLTPESYAGLSTARKLQVMAQLGGLVGELRADFQILRVARPWSVDDYLTSAWQTFDRRHGDTVELASRSEGFRALLDTHVAAMGERSIVRPEVYLLVRLDDMTPVLPGLLDGSTLRRLLGGVRSAIRYDDPRRLSHAQLLDLQRAERAVFGTVSSYLSAKRALASQIAWLVRRAYRRGLGDAAPEPNFKPQVLAVRDADGEEIGFEPLEWNMLRLHADHRVRIGARHLEIDGEWGSSFQTTLVSGALPEEREFPGPEAELMFAPVDLEFPVDAWLRCEYMPNPEAQRLARKRVLDADQIWREETISDSGASPDAEDRPVEARHLQRRLGENDHPPLFRSILSYVFGTPDGVDDLDERVARLRTAAGQRLQFHRPVALQHELFLAGLPAGQLGGGEYRELLLPEEIAAMVPTASNYAGSEIGPYIGYTLTASAVPIRLDLAEPVQQDKTAAMLMTGASGSGKTNFMSLLEYQAFWQGSAPIVHIDPKGTPEDPDHKLHLFSEIAAVMEQIQLSGDERYRGLIDPLRIAAPEIRADAAFSFAIDLLPSPVEPIWQTEVRAAIDEVCGDADRPKVMGEVVATLERGGEAAKEAGRALRVHGSSGLAKLAFGEVGRDIAEVGTARVVVFQIKNLELPRPGTSRSEMTSEERLGTALLRLIAIYALRLCTETSSRHSILGTDEAWVFFGTSIGRSLLDRMNRLGRSRNVTPLLATQLVAEAEEIEGLVGAIASGGVKSVEEAKRSLRQHGDDEEDEGQIQRLMNFEKGRFLFRDYEGQSVPMQVDLCDPRVRETLGTTPPRRGGNAG
jgi:hypothetical protein